MTYWPLAYNGHSAQSTPTPFPLQAHASGAVIAHHIWDIHLLWGDLTYNKRFKISI